MGIAGGKIRRVAVVVVVALVASLLHLTAVAVAQEAAREPVVRLGGADRVGTAVAASAAHWPVGADEVVVATAERYPDALAGGALARRLGGPVLLTWPDRLPEEVVAELDRLAARRVTLVGGTRAVNASVEAALASSGRTVRRLAGGDRMATAAAVAAEVGTPDGVVALALGRGRTDHDGWADALVTGTLGVPGRRIPTLLTERDALPAATADALRALGAREVVVVGGTDAVSGAVVRAVEATGAATRRLGGRDRLATAVEVARAAIAGRTEFSLLVATSADYPDSLVAGGLTARLGAPILLVPADLPAAGPVNPIGGRLRAVAPELADFLVELCPRIDTAHLLGLQGAVSDEVADELRFLLTCRSDGGAGTAEPGAGGGGGGPGGPPAATTTTAPAPTTTTTVPNGGPAVVPDVVGRQQGPAVSDIFDANLSLGQVQYARSATVTAGRVLSQDPVGGTNVAAGSPVGLRVSLGPEPLVVPDVVGLDRDDAEDEVEEAGFTVGRVAEIRSDDVEVGEVGAQLPLAGQQALPGTPVDLDVAVDATNQPPEITTTPAGRHTTGSPYTYVPVAMDPDADDLTWSLQAGPDAASVDPETGAVLSWDPARADAGPTDLVVRVADGRGGIDTQSWTVRVTVPNRAPSAADDDHVAVAGQTLDVPAAGVLGNDVDPDGDDVSARLVRGPQSGALDLDEDGSFRYTPNTPADAPLLEDVELVGQAGGRATATSAYDSRYPASNLTDGDLTTSWFSARNATLPQTVTITFPGDVSVTDLSLRGNRSAAESGYGVVTGVLRLLGRDGDERFTTGEITLPASPAGDGADRDLDLDVAAANGGPVAGVRRVQFEIRSVETRGSYPGLAEITVAGDGRPIDLPTTEEWSFLGQGTELTPSVADLDGDGVPEVLFTTMDSRLRVVDGRDGSAFWTVAPFATAYSASPVVGDLHPSPGLEVAMSFGNDVTVYSATGSVIDSAPTGQAIGEGNMAVADLDGDGTPELIVPGSGRVSAWGLDGDELVRRWLSPAEGCGNNAYRSNCIPIVADVDLDGRPEIVAGNVVYGPGGAVEATNTAVPDGWNAVGQFDEDAEAEIVVVTGGRVYLLEHDLTVRWGPVAIPQGGLGGAPTVADVDGDGAPEIGVAGASRYAVLDTDGSLLWEAETVDGSSNRTGSTVFDFDNDGATEVVYRDERHLWIFAGPNGAVRAKIPVGSSTTVESPVVADIDADGQAEIVVSSDNSAPLPGGGSRPRGLYVFGGGGDWVRARSIWNQHSYHVTNVGPDGKVPTVEQPSWLASGLNSYRENAFLFDDPGRADRFTYRAVDEDGEVSAPATVVLDVVAPRNDPRITSRPRTTATLGYRYLYAVAAEDPDPGSTLRFALADGPEGMVIDPVSGVLSWTPTATEDASFPVGVTVTDQTGRAVQQRFAVTVLEPVVIPDVVGSTLAVATQEIEDAGLRVGRVTRAVIGARPRGEVDAQDPGAGGHAEVGGRVHLVVSDGPDPAAADDDGDGFSVRDGDCDDADDEIVPGGTDGAGDDIDQDCDGSDGALSADGLLVNPVDPVRRVGGTVQMVAAALVDGCTCQDVTRLATWSSSEPGVATVGIHGVVRGVAAGSTIVTARFDGHEASRTVRIVAPREPDQTLPTVSVTAPAVGARVTQPVDVLGTAADEDLRDWTLVLTRADGALVAPLGGSSTSVVDGLLATFDPDGLAPGNYAFLLTATDRSGNALAVRHPITVPPPDDPDDPDDPGCEPDCEPGDPALDGILLNPVNPAVLVGGALSLQATAYYDDGSSEPVGTRGTWSTADAGIVTVDDRGRVTGVAPGTANVTVVFDGGTASRPVRVVAPAAAAADRVAPVTRFTTPATAVEVREPLQVLGVVTDDELLRWELALTDGTGEVVSAIADGSAPVDGGALGTLDPTLLLNGSFTLQLTATDTSGNTSSATVPVIIEGQRKIGAFSLSMTDLVVPVAGIPLEVTRAYDTRDDGVGEFGHGWRLGISRLRLTTSGVQGEGWTVVRGRFSFALQPLRSHTVTLTLPDGTTERFEATMSPSVGTFVPLVAGTMSYVPHPGTRGRLSVVGNREVVVLGSQPGEVELVDDSSFDAFDPERFVYTAADGSRFELEGDGTLRSITDPSGNTLTVGHDGLTHSAGRSVKFERDALDRIVAIVDPAGNRQRYAYDADGDLASHTDAEGNTTRYRYTGSHDLVEIIDPLGRPVARYEYDDDGRLVAAVDAEGRRTELRHDLGASTEVVSHPGGAQELLTYDARGNVVAQTDELGRTTRQTFDAEDNLLSRTDPSGTTLTFTYDAAGNETSRTDDLGNTTSFRYDAQDRVIEKRDPLGHTTTYLRDATGRVLRRKDAAGGVTQWSYDRAGNVVTMVDAGGATTTYAYDRFGNRTKATDPLGNEFTTSFDANSRPIAVEAVVTTADGQLSLTQTTRYDRRGRPVEAIDPAGGRWTTTYDATGQLTGQSGPLGRTMSYEYDASGRRTGTTFPDGQELEAAYDARGHLAWTDDPNGGRNHLEYDAAGNLSRQVFPDDTPADLADNPARGIEVDVDDRAQAIVDETGGRTTFTYDDGGQLATVTDEVGATTTKAYDAAGRMMAETDALGRRTSYAYDELDRVVRVTTADGASTSWTYDEVGEVSSTTDPEGRVTRFVHDDARRLTAVIDATGARTAYGYDELGTLVSVLDAEGRSTRYEHDRHGYVSAIIHPGGQREERRYDEDGLLVERTDPNGAATTYTYDELRRPLEITYADGSTVRYAYDGLGNVTSVEDERGTTEVTWDERGRLLSRTEPDGRTIAYEYHLDSTVAAVVTPSGRTTYEYDEAGRPVSVEDADGATTTMRYDAVGNLLETALPNGVVETRAYDDVDRLVELTVVAPGGVSRTTTYTYDRSGQLLVAEGDGARSTYAYDAARRLVRETHASGAESRDISYRYDAVGNRVERRDSVAGTTAYVYDAGDRLVSETTGSVTASYAYDANGNTLSRTTSTGQRTYAWGPGDRLVGAHDAREGVPSSSSTYAYDAGGIRTAQVVDGEETRYLLDAAGALPHVVEEYRPDGTTVARSTLAGNRISRTEDGETRWYHADRLGTVVASSDESGRLAAAPGRDAFGRVTGVEGTAQPYAFTGEANDATGLSYLRMRYLDPDTGRFLSADRYPGSVERPATFHRYQYAHSDPVNLTDPTGLMPSLTQIAVATMIAATLVAAFQITMALTASSGLDIEWAGPTIDISPDIGKRIGGIGVSFGGSSFKATSNGHETRALHLTVGLGVSTPKLDIGQWLVGKGQGMQKAAKRAPRDQRAVLRGAGGGLEGAGFLLALSEHEFSKINVSIGDATLYSPSILGGANGIDPRALSGAYIKAGISAGGGLWASVINGLGGSLKNTAGYSVLAQGFGLGYSIPDTSIDVNPTAGASYSAGGSINITPSSWINQPAK